MANFGWLDEYMLAKPGVTKDFKEEWGWQRYMVGGKMFAAIMRPSAKYNADYAEKDLISLKCDPDLAELLRREHSEIMPGFYTDKRWWNSIDLGGALDRDMLREMIDNSYALVFAKLTKKLQAEVAASRGDAAALEFSFLEKSEFDALAPALFGLYHENMSRALQTDETYPGGFERWRADVGGGLKKDPRRIVLIRAGGEIAGFFMYYVNNGLFMMEEAQLAPEWQGKGALRRLLGFLLPLFPAGVDAVESCAHTANDRSRRVLRRMGLAEVGGDGAITRFCGSFASLLKWHTA